MKTFINTRHALSIVMLVILMASCTYAPSGNAPIRITNTPILVSTPVTTSTTTLTGGIGILGDSTSDEYQADDARGGQYNKRTLNWMEQLVKGRGLNFGNWGTWGEPRRTGYEYNWARSSATVNSMITSGQHTGLAKQVAEGKVSYVLMWIGNNDFHLSNGSYAEIYNGMLTDADIQVKTDQMEMEITTAMDVILQAGDVKMAIVSIADQGIAPQAMIQYPDSEKRKRVTNVINNLNTRISEAANARGIIVLDGTAIGKALLSRVDMFGNLKIGQQNINVLIKGNEPHHLQLDDISGHAGTVLSGIIANSIFIQPFNDAFGLDIKPLTDDEILKYAGID